MGTVAWQSPKLACYSAFSLLLSECGPENGSSFSSSFIAEASCDSPRGRLLHSALLRRRAVVLLVAPLTAVEAGRACGHARSRLVLVGVALVQVETVQRGGGRDDDLPRLGVIRVEAASVPGLFQPGPGVRRVAGPVFLMCTKFASASSTVSSSVSFSCGKPSSYSRSASSCSARVCTLRGGTAQCGGSVDSELTALLRALRPRDVRPQAAPRSENQV